VDDETPAIVAETERYRVFQARWPVLDGMTAEGLLVEPIRATPSASLVAVPDAGQTPEQILGLASGLTPERQFARLLRHQTTGDAVESWPESGRETDAPRIRDLQLHDLSGGRRRLDRLELVTRVDKR